MEFAQARLHPALAPFVRSIIGARLRGAEPARQLELPVAGTAVIIELSPEPWEVGARADAPLVTHRSFAGGLSLAPAVSAHTGAYELVQLVLTPAGTVALFGEPLAGQVVALDALLGPEAARLAERVAERRGWAERFAVVERWLLARLAAPVLPPEVAWALRRLDATGGSVTIGTLQAELGCSRRHLATRFTGAVGTTPKRYAQLVRFTGAAARLRGGAAPIDVAAACGYADQAHLTRHVRRFGATTPGALRGAGPEPKGV